jgi:hypothetical protein
MVFHQELCMSTTPAPQEQISTHYRPIRSVSVTSIRQLYEVFAACHDHPSLDVFIRELGQKSGVIVIVRQSDHRIVGFSTQTVAKLDVDGKRVLTLLSDDAVVLPKYWAQNDLAAAAQTLLLKLKLRHPTRAVYWCQLARHYRSYLLMAGQARQLYPSAGGVDPGLKRIAQTLGKQLFPDAFDSRRMLLSFSGDHVVRPNLPVVEFTPAMASADPRIALFKKMNPGWRRGTALLGVSEFDTQSAMRSLWAMPSRWIRLHILRNYKPTGSTLEGQANSQQQASWRDSSLDEALERGETS